MQPAPLRAGLRPDHGRLRVSPEVDAAEWGTVPGAQEVPGRREVHDAAPRRGAGTPPRPLRRTGQDPHGSDRRGVPGPVHPGALRGEPAQAVHHRPEERDPRPLHQVEAGDRRLDQIRDQDIARLKADLKDLSPKTVNNVLVTLSTMLKAAREWGVIAYLPCTIKLLKVSVGTVEFYEQPDYERLVAAARELDPRIELLRAPRRRRRPALGRDHRPRADRLRHAARHAPRAQVGVEGARHAAEGRPRTAGQHDRPSPRRADGEQAPARRTGALARRRLRQGHRGALREVDAAGAAAGWTQGDGRPPHPPAHVLLSPGDGRRARRGRSRSSPDTTSITTTQRYMHLSPGVERRAAIRASGSCLERFGRDIVDDGPGAVEETPGAVGTLRRVGETGFEPATPWSRTKCSTRLSHSPLMHPPELLPGLGRCPDPA